MFTLLFWSSIHKAYRVSKLYLSSKEVSYITTNKQFSPKSLRLMSNYSPKWRWINQDILGFSPTLRWIITLVYTNQWISEVKNYNLCIFKPHFEIGTWQLFRVSVTISASLVKLRRRIRFKNKILAWKTPKPNFFVLTGMAFSFISEIWASFKLSGNRDAILSISCAVMRARNI